MPEPPARRDDLYRRAETAWGADAQMNKAAEEFAEAAAALNRALNDQGSREDVLEELADVRLVLEQMERSFFEADEVDAAIARAVDDLEDRLEEHGDG
mgnify:CR=1 FL=1